MNDLKCLKRHFISGSQVNIFYRSGTLETKTHANDLYFIGWHWRLVDQLMPLI